MTKVTAPSITPKNRWWHNHSSRDLCSQAIITRLQHSRTDHDLVSMTTDRKWDLFTDLAPMWFFQISYTSLKVRNYAQRNGQSENNSLGTVSGRYLLFPPRCSISRVHLTARMRSSNQGFKYINVYSKAQLSAIMQF